ncbi:MAG: hypothetical protein M1817_004988 [Caeruleum heppii]|nr:MAG: hypothetical protein M1817_004988 [Caeruleum heppii]
MATTESDPSLRNSSSVPQVDDLDMVSENVPLPSATARLEKGSRILQSYDEIPGWHQDNDCIRHGYRPVSDSAKACFASWIYIHNETVNIYSHLVPAILFVILQIVIHRVFQSIYPLATAEAHLVFAFFLLTAAVCLGMSATYHTMVNHSQKVSERFLRLDFAGIVVLTLGDFVSGIYVVFFCEKSLQRMYWGMITALCIVTMIFLVSPRFQGRKWRTLRVCVFVGTGLSGLAPLAQGIALWGFKGMMKQSGMPFYIGEGLLLLLGAFFYTTRIPEVLKPGRFDYFGCSHQIFHLLVVLATVVHLIGIVLAFDYNYEHRQVDGDYTGSIKDSTPPPSRVGPPHSPRPRFQAIFRDASNKLARGLPIAAGQMLEEVRENSDRPILEPADPKAPRAVTSDIKRKHSPDDDVAPAFAPTTARSSGWAIRLPVPLQSPTSFSNEAVTGESTGAAGFGWAERK